MKIEIPEKVRVVMVITERIGIPTLICLAFAYIYFTKLQKVMDNLTEIRTDMKVNSENNKIGREEIMREIRRLGYKAR